MDNGPSHNCKDTVKIYNITDMHDRNNAATLILLFP